jgi:hypothetical protein
LASQFIQNAIGAHRSLSFVAENQIRRPKRGVELTNPQPLRHPGPDAFPTTGSDLFWHADGHVVPMLRLGCGKHLYPAFLAGQVKVQLDINCQMGVTEFVSFLVMAQFGKILLSHSSSPAIARLVVATVGGICVHHQTAAAAPVCLTNTHRNLSNEGSAPRWAKQTSSSP